MTIYTLHMPVAIEDYSFSLPNNLNRVETAGGSSRLRADLGNMYLTVSVQWKLTVAKYAEFWNFFKIGTNRGGNPFYLKLPIERATPEIHLCNFQSPQLSNIIGDYYVITDTLYVKPLDIDETADLALITAFGD